MAWERRLHPDQRRAAARRTVGDVHPIACLRVLDARLHGGTHFTSGRYGGLVSGGGRENNDTRTVRYTLKDIPQSPKSCHLQDDLDGLDGHLREIESMARSLSRQSR